MRKLVLVFSLLSFLSVALLTERAQAWLTCEGIFSSAMKGMPSRKSFSLEPYQLALQNWATQEARNSPPGSKARVLRIEVENGSETVGTRDGEASRAGVKGKSNGAALPSVHALPEARVLKVPASYLASATDENFQKYMRQLLIGQASHPYLSRTAPSGAMMPKILRPVQREGIRAARFAQEAGLKKFPYVSPTATGKSEVLIQVLNERIEKRPEKLHIVIADLRHLVQQLGGDVKASLKVPAHVREWGGENKSQPLREVLELAQQAGPSAKPVVLVTTMRSLKDRFAEYQKQDPTLGQLRDVLGTIVYDEAHHLGAEQADRLIENLIDHPQSKAFLIGATATPVHRNAKFEELFDGHGFWSYLDTAESYAARIRESKNSFERPLTSILDQMESAIDEGDLTPFNDFHVLQPRYLKEGEERGPWRVDDPKVLAALEGELKPLFSKHKRGFVSVGSVAEAERLALFLQEKMGVNARAFHSEQSDRIQNQTEQDFRSGKIGFLVTIRKLDEGMNYPDLSLFIDLNRTLGVRQMLQRIGRVLRISKGKEYVDIAMMVDVDRSTAAEMIEFFERVHRRAFSGAFFGALVSSKGALNKSSSSAANAESPESKLARVVTEIKGFWGKKNRYVSYLEASEWAQAQGITGQTEWNNRAKTDPDWPKNIPKSPQREYEQSWGGWKKFLNTEPVSYEDASKWAQEQGFKIYEDWRHAIDTWPKGKWPVRIPKTPDYFYRNKGWIDWPHFLGTEFLSMREAMLWAQQQGIATSGQWDARTQQPGWPENIPKRPWDTYRKEGWQGWPHFLGNDFVGYAAAKKWAQAHRFRNREHWYLRAKEPDWPMSIPKAPNSAYAEEWEGWKEFLGNIPKEPAEGTP